MRKRNLFGLVVILALIGTISMQARAQESWTDPATGLMWALQDHVQDSGAGVSWNQASGYCANLDLAGLSHWRLATIDELAAIYVETKVADGNYHIKGGIQLSGQAMIWSSTAGNDPGKALMFSFLLGVQVPYPRDASTMSALCVRHS
jgi:hypothetical protein